MNCKITYTPDFAKAIKRLNKRYRSLKQDYAKLLADLHSNPLLGTDLGHRLRKVRNIKGQRQERRSKGNYLYRDIDTGRC